MTQSADRTLAGNSTASTTCTRSRTTSPCTRKGTRVIVKAEGVYLYDSEGNRILDGMAGLWCVNLGYGRRELAEAAYRQMLRAAVLQQLLPDRPPAGDRAARSSSST